MSRPVIVIGAGGHAKVLIAALNALQRAIIGIFESDPAMVGQSIVGIPILGNDDNIKNYMPETIELVNGIGSISSTEKRKEIYIKFKNYGYSFASVIHPSATLVDGVQLGEGVQIMAGAIVQTGCTIGDNVIINTGAVIDHDCKIGSHVHIAPGAVLSGSVEIGAMNHIGSGSTIIQGIKISNGVIVGAGAVVIKDVPANVKIFGVPAKLIERR